MGSPWTMAGTPTGPDGQARSPRVPALQERTPLMPVYLALCALFTFEVFMAATDLSVFPVFPEHVTPESERPCIGCRPGPAGHVRGPQAMNTGSPPTSASAFLLSPSTFSHFISSRPCLMSAFPLTPICKPVSFHSKAYPTNICYKTHLLLLLLSLLLCMLPYCYYLPPF